MKKSKISIKVNIADRYYPLSIDGAEEENVRKAASLINEKTKFYNANFTLKDKQDALAMAALEFASDLLKCSDKGSSNNDYLDKKLFQIQSLMDEWIDTKD